MKNQTRFFFLFNRKEYSIRQQTVISETIIKNDTRRVLLSLNCKRYYEYARLNDIEFMLTPLRFPLFYHICNNVTYALTCSHSLIRRPFDFNSILVRYLSCFLAIGRVHKSDRLLCKKRNEIVWEGKSPGKNSEHKYSISMLSARSLPTFLQ